MTNSTWNKQPVSGEWNIGTNWQPSQVPTEKAVFNGSSHTTISFSADSTAQVGQIEFSRDASAYAFVFGSSETPALTISGQGVLNHSGRQQSFIVAATSSGYKNPQLNFVNSANAGGDDLFYCAGPESEEGYGGGVICFNNQASAGSAAFKAWTGAAAPPKHNTVGGEISFCDNATADRARFTIYGSLGKDGDTFGNVVFHQNATAAQAVFTNVGGTVSGGDGGNTQFYGNSSAGNGVFYNWGGTHEKANGGDVAFDATATGGEGYYHNYAAKAANAYGGVTSFNNNPPDTTEKGASAGNGFYINFGARGEEQGGGGHLEFSAKYGSPTADNATIINYGSSLSHKSCAGHTIFSINLPAEYFPTAGRAIIHNHPGLSAEGAAGFTAFSVYGSGSGARMPDAGEATILNYGGTLSKAAGGYTVFSGVSKAENATLIAYGGTHGGYGGRIIFYDKASGGAAKIQLYGNGELDLSHSSNDITIGELELTGGSIVLQLSAGACCLSVSGHLRLFSQQVSFSFVTKDQNDFAYNTPYTILRCSDLSEFVSDQFTGNDIGNIKPTFTISGDELQVSFVQK